MGPLANGRYKWLQVVGVIVFIPSFVLQDAFRVSDIQGCFWGKVRTDRPRPRKGGVLYRLNMYEIELPKCLDNLGWGMMPICPTYPPKTNMTMDNQPFEDVLYFLLKMGIFHCHVGFCRCCCFLWLFTHRKTHVSTLTSYLVTSEFSLLGPQWTASSGFKSRDPTVLDLQGGKSMASSTWCRSSAAEISREHASFFGCEKWPEKDAQRSQHLFFWDNSPLHFLVIYIYIYICVCVCVSFLGVLHCLRLPAGFFKQVFFNLRWFLSWSIIELFTLGIRMHARQTRFVGKASWMVKLQRQATENRTQMGPLVFGWMDP